ncbi:uncharacterized protein BJ171DRAFT_577687 [Polychytrium aggregatum]|uniref:uncharacterized protein n=1 Tax=Polychytrium aggregatum TaxID=110093 RepID=UPI0022FDC41C|nr:uncharacterized protein BJ171DRAFT_577687 [Polychytrium aggregatum]KAI9208585.1 hypothetical protein BJ171DRAFT_577687 [Polychytrium aggregatum]
MQDNECTHPSSLPQESEHEFRPRFYSSPAGLGIKKSLASVLEEDEEGDFDSSGEFRPCSLSGSIVAKPDTSLELKYLARKYKMERRSLDLWAASHALGSGTQGPETDDAGPSKNEPLCSEGDGDDDSEDLRQLNQRLKECSDGFELEDESPLWKKKSAFEEGFGVDFAALDHPHRQQRLVDGDIFPFPETIIREPIENVNKRWMESMEDIPQSERDVPETAAHAHHVSFAERVSAECKGTILSEKATLIQSPGAPDPQSLPDESAVPVKYSVDLSHLSLDSGYESRRESLMKQIRLSSGRPSMASTVNRSMSVATACNEKSPCVIKLAPPSVLPTDTWAKNQQALGEISETRARLERLGMYPPKVSTTDSWVVRALERVVGRLSRKRLFLDFSVNNPTNRKKSHEDVDISAA